MSDKHEAAAYIADMTLGLCTLARRTRLNFLAYLLEMVVTEALERSGRR